MKYLKLLESESERDNYWDNYLNKLNKSERDNYWDNYLNKLNKKHQFERELEKERGNYYKLVDDDAEKEELLNKKMFISDANVNKILKMFPTRYNADIKYQGQLFSWELLYDIKISHVKPYRYSFIEAHHTGFYVKNKTGGGYVFKDSPLGTKSEDEGRESYTSCIYRIYEIPDEWFLVGLGGGDERGRIFFKCDQFEGLEYFLKNTIKNEVS